MTHAGPDETIWHYDGSTATRHHPRITWDVDGFTLHHEAGMSGPHHWRDLVPVSGAHGRSVYGLRRTAGWRLGFTGRPPEAFAINLPLPARYGRWVDRIGLWRAVALFAVIAAGTVYAALRAPEWIAPYVPRSWEDRLGDAMVGDFGGRICETAASVDAVETLRAMLGDDVPVRRISIVNVKLVNAVALPGGHILIFDQLVQEAASPDELAGVLAHEIGHVRNRDTLTALVRQLGLSIVLGGFSGDVGGAVNSLLALGYSREAERAADDYSIAALRAANVSPLPTAAFFDRLGRQSGGDALERSTSWMASHPVSAERRAAFERSARKGHRYAPALTARQWQALRNVCKDDKTVAPATGFDF